MTHSRRLLIYLNQRRYEQGMTAAALSRAAGYEGERFSNMLEQPDTVTVDELIAFADVLGFNIFLAAKQHMAA